MRLSFLHQLFKLLLMVSYYEVLHNYSVLCCDAVEQEIRVMDVWLSQLQQLVDVIIVL